MEEDFDIDLDDPETAKAATKIQAGFRGSKARKEVVSLRQERIDIDDGDDVKKSNETKFSAQNEKNTTIKEEIVEGKYQNLRLGQRLTTVKPSTTWPFTALTSVLLDF